MSKILFQELTDYILPSDVVSLRGYSAQPPATPSPGGFIFLDADHSKFSVDEGLSDI